MNVVTYETAKRLKDAGFAQPKGVFGQMFGFIHPDTCQIHKAIVGSAMYHMSAMHDLIFMPCATDILKELPEYSMLMHDGDGWACNVDGNGSLFRNNPAEACAAAWLAIHEKTETK